MTAPFEPGEDRGERSSVGGGRRTASDDRHYAHERMEAVWRVRANRLSKSPLAEQRTQGARRVIVLGLGAERYAVNLADVADVLPLVRVTPVPGAAAAIAGVINVHGEIRPVIDLRQLLGLEKPVGDDGARVVLLRREGREIGLRIDSVGQIVWIEAEKNMTGSEEIDRAPDGDAEYLPRILSKYITRSTGDMLMLLSTEALYAELDAA